MGIIKLSKTKSQNIRKLYFEGGLTHEIIAKKYKVSRGHITKIINNQRWDKNKYRNDDDTI